MVTYGGANKVCHQAHVQVDMVSLCNDYLVAAMKAFQTGIPVVGNAADEIYESSATSGGTRGKRTLKATPQQPFKLKTERRGRSKQEEFMKKVQEMTIEQEKYIAKGLPWTADEPECLTRLPVKESIGPVDLVLHNDMRAMERAEFDHQVQEKLSFIEQFKLERERQQKLAEEEELRRLRKDLVPKAQPMPYFDRPFIPKKSEKQSKMPRDPKFRKPKNKKMNGGF